MIMNNLKKFFLMVVIMLVAVGIVACGQSSTKSSDQADSKSQTTETKTETKSSEPVVLKVVQGWPSPVNWNRLGEDYMDRVEKATEGKVKFNIVGGPEAIPTFEQGEAVRNGVVDMYFGAANYYSGELPVADAMKLIRIPAPEARDKGIYDFWNKVHAESLNAYYLGNQLPTYTAVKFHLYTTKPVKTLDDFKGLTIRVTPIYRAFVDALGAAPTTIESPEVYTALERGMVEGLGWPGIGLMDLGWDEVIKYRIDPGFYMLDGSVLVNLDTWNKLDPEVRAKMEEIMKEFEKELPAIWEQESEKEKGKLQEAGIEIIELDSEVGKQFVEKAYEVGWQDILNRAPKEGAELKALLEK